MYLTNLMMFQRIREAKKTKIRKSMSCESGDPGGGRNNVTDLRFPRTKRPPGQNRIPIRLHVTQTWQGTKLPFFLHQLFHFWMDGGRE